MFKSAFVPVCIPLRHTNKEMKALFSIRIFTAHLSVPSVHHSEPYIPNSALGKRRPWEIQSEASLVQGCTKVSGGLSCSFSLSHPAAGSQGQPHLGGAAWQAVTGQSHCQKPECELGISTTEMQSQGVCHRVLLRTELSFLFLSSRVFFL